MSRTLRLRILALSAALAIPGTPVFAQERPKPPEEKPKPAKKPKKIWTEDDVHSVRKPWHDYQDQQAAEAAEAARAAAEAKAQSATPAAQAPSADPAASATAENPANVASELAPSKVYVPETTEGIQKQVDVYQRTISSYHQRIADCRTKYFDTGDDEQRAELMKEIDFLNSEIEKFEADLKVLEASLEKRLAAGENQPPAASAPQPRM